MISKERIEALKQLAQQTYVSRITTLELREVFEYYEAQQEQKLVSIPAKVADAIEYYRSFNLYGMINAILNNPRLEDQEVRKILMQNYDEPWDTLIRAVVIGYTVETIESKIKAGVLNIYLDWLSTPFETTDSADEEEFAQRITNFVTQVIREDQA